MFWQRLAPIRRAVWSQRRPCGFHPHLERLEQRDVPAASVVVLKDLGNQGVTLRGFEDTALPEREMSMATALTT